MDICNSFGSKPSKLTILGLIAIIVVVGVVLWMVADDPGGFLGVSSPLVRVMLRSVGGLRESLVLVFRGRLVSFRRALVVLHLLLAVQLPRWGDRNDGSDWGYLKFVQNKLAPFIYKLLGLARRSGKLTAFCTYVHYIKKLLSTWDNRLDHTTIGYKFSKINYN